MNPYPVLEAQVLYRPLTDALRFLPEGPRSCAPGFISWVAIQHGSDATNGSLNVFDLQQRSNETYELPARVGFAFPTNRDGVFLIGLERQLALYDVNNHSVDIIGEPVEQNVSGTIINDAEFFPEGVVFGAKDLNFAEAKAGLYLFRLRDRRVFQLSNDQVCSNGKIITANQDGTYRVLNIDTLRKNVMEYRLDVEKAELRFERTALDLTHYCPYPDGMTSTPDGQGVIIAFYNPQDSVCGEARQFDLATGDIVAAWTTPDAPQVTCPQLVQWNGRVKLILTTAVEHMNADRQKKYRNSGCLFVADTMFTAAPPLRRVQLE